MYRFPCWWFIAACVMLGLVGTPWVQAQGRRRAAVRPPALDQIAASWIDVRGSLDNMKVATDAHAAITHAAADNRRIILHINAHQWRMDVVAAIAASIAEHADLVSVWIADPKDHKVCSGAAILALGASEAFIDPGTTITMDSADERKDLEPDAPPSDASLTRLLAFASAHIAERGMDPLLPRTLLLRTPEMWAVETSDPSRWRLAPSDPGSTGLSEKIVRSAPPASIEGSIRADLAIKLGIAASKAASQQDLRQYKVTSRPVVITSGLANAQRRVTSDLDFLSRAESVIETILTTKPPDQRVNTRPFYDNLRVRATGVIVDAEASLRSIDKSIADYPEITRGAPPGVSADPTSRKATSAEWHKLVQKRRDTLEKLRTRTEKLGPK